MGGHHDEIHTKRSRLLAYGFVDWPRRVHYVNLRRHLSVSAKPTGHEALEFAREFLPEGLPILWREPLPGRIVRVERIGQGRQLEGVAEDDGPRAPR